MKESQNRNTNLFRLFNYFTIAELKKIKQYNFPLLAQEALKLQQKRNGCEYCGKPSPTLSFHLYKKMGKGISSGHKGAGRFCSKKCLIQSLGKHQLFRLPFNHNIKDRIMSHLSIDFRKKELEALTPEDMLRQINLWIKLYNKCDYCHAKQKNDWCLDGFYCSKDCLQRAFKENVV